MPLPNNGMAWPPAQLDIVGPQLEAWSAWYSGDPDKLRAAYQQSRPTAAFDKVAQHRGGVVGALARFWWGRPIEALSSQRVDQLHVPIAADLCQASADLIYAEPPTITADDTAAQDRIAELVDDGLHTVLVAGAEVGAALGGRYHRVTWDREVVPDRPFLTTVHADAAYPEFRWGHLVAVTFWHVLQVDGQRVVRHLEKHELVDGMGWVFHGLYEGTQRNLGTAMPLEQHPATAALASEVDEMGALRDGRTPGLLVEYIPNQRPNRLWRNDPLGANLGRSDLQGVEGQMDALDETYSSWMRDIRLAKSRVFIPDYMMKPNAPGGGTTFDLDREVYVPIRSAAPEDADAKITMNQFKIRVAEHRETAQELTEVILRSAGYSAQTFGEGGAGGAMTATEVLSKERRSYLTRDRKIRLERPAVARLVEKLLAVDKELFGGAAEAVRPAVSFGDAIQESPLTLAQTALALKTADAASTRTLVQLVHPDWDDKKVDDEVVNIQASRPAPAADPFNFTG